MRLKGLVRGGSSGPCNDLGDVGENSIPTALRLELVLPYPKDQEPAMTQLALSQSSPCSVSQEFFSPVLPMRSGKGSLAGRAAMPKAPVDEEGDSVRRKYEIRSARKTAIMHRPLSNPTSHDHGSNCPFRGAVPFGADLAHSRRALRFRQDIHGSTG